MRTTIRAGLLIGALLALQGAAHGSVINLPLRFWTGQGVNNEFGQLLPGTPASPGALVQILNAQDGVYPPDINGNPHPSNAVVCVLYIGQGADPALPATGMAHGNAISNRFQAVKLVARYFNRGTAAESSFYTDSQVFTNSTTDYSAFTAIASQTTTPLDVGDSDGDGLNNSWEKSLGTNPMLADSDGDTVSDFHEMLAGTGAMDPDSFLNVSGMVPRSNYEVQVKWNSVAGKTYQLQQTTEHLATPGAQFVDVNDPVTATNEESSTVVTNVPGTGLQNFRIRLVVP